MKPTQTANNITIVNVIKVVPRRRAAKPKQTMAQTAIS
jgi:hypothetical protein